VFAEESFAEYRQL